MTISIGVHVHAEPDRLLETVRSISAHTGPSHELVLLVDGPDAQLAVALQTHPELAGLPQMATAEALGPPACFNRLAFAASAEAVVFLESGSVVGPRWLDVLVSAVGAPGRGLAGPSTNRSWNEQGALPLASGTLDGVRQAAGEVERRFGRATVHTLEPLYSLADFCYLVRREVIAAIGGADEAFGLGPCWEMDYNIRAARAGFAGVYAPAAFVYRHPMTARRQAAEHALMDRNRRLYQDRFCALRLRGERQDYEAHCQGGACEHFAPTALITITRRPGDGPAAAAAAAEAPAASTPRPALPLVTCVMPTRNRPELANRAVRYFLAQDYPNTELVIVEDGTSELARTLPADNRIRHFYTPEPRSIGAMRNQACALARGEILAQWDDDDWYHNTRLSRQVAPLLDQSADITALRDTLMLELPGWRFWRCSPELHRRLFVADVHGGTLVYRRQVWMDLARYPDVSLAEDAVFLQQALRRGARLRPLDENGLFLYVRHGANAWDLRCGVQHDPAGWQLVAEPALPSDDRAFYASMSPAAPPPPPATPSARAMPLVSCIMPTLDRRPFVRQAIGYFLRQDYPARELVIVDDGVDAVADLVPPDPRIRYHRLDRRLILGAKRNAACELAAGPLIAHWDDDDWIAPSRLRVQVAALERRGVDVCGASHLLFYQPERRLASCYAYPPAERPWVAGSSLLYRKELWARSPFPEVPVGEDTRFVWSPAVRALADVGDDRCVVGIIHSRNTATKSARGAYWSSRPVEEVEHLLGADLDFYRQLVALAPPA